MLLRCVASLAAASSRRLALVSAAHHRSIAASASAAQEHHQGPAVTLVFGATGGIGSALAHCLHNNAQPSGSQAQALVLSAHNEEKLKALQHQLKGVDAIAADARDPASVERVVQEVLQRYGRLDGVVSCVGSVVARSALATDLQELQETLDVNLVTSFNILKASVRGMMSQHDKGHQQQQQTQQTQQQSEEEEGRSRRSRGGGGGGGGSIVLVSAALASHGVANYEAMSAAKAAVEGLARSAAATYSHHGIRVNCVAPGLTRTPQTQRFTDNSKVAGASAEMHPDKELAEPEQVAAALEFFLRPENHHITGQVLAVDGGLSTLHPHRAQEYGV